MKEWYSSRWNRDKQTPGRYESVEYVDVGELIVDHLKDEGRKDWERRSETERVQWFNEQVDRQHAFLDGPVSTSRTDFSRPAEASDHVRRFCLENGVDLVGFAPLDPAFVYKGYSLAHKYAISLGKRMDPEKLKLVPYSSNYECMRVYYELGGAVVKLADHIRGLGYPARAHHPVGGRGTTQVEHLPIAWSAGLGELGRHGSLINPVLGSWFRLGTVTTDLEVEPGEPLHGEVNSFCAHCNMCARHCPGGAISKGPMEIANGTVRWVVDTEKCIPYFIELRSCAVCIQVCPWNAKALDGNLRTEYRLDAPRFKSLSGESYKRARFAENEERYL
jgi:ferredoxin